MIAVAFWWIGSFKKSFMGTSLMVQWLRLHCRPVSIWYYFFWSETSINISSAGLLETYSLFLFLLLLLLLSRVSRVWLRDPIDGSPPGSPVPGILQARTLEWVAISSSNASKWKAKVKSLSCVRLPVTPWTAAHHASLSMGFSSQEYWSGVPLPSPHFSWDIFILPSLLKYSFTET